MLPEVFLRSISPQKTFLTTLTVALLCVFTIIVSPVPHRGHTSAAIKFSPSEVRQELSRFFKKHELLKIDSRKAARQIRQTKRFSLITSGGALDLILIPHDMRGIAYRAVEMRHDRAERTLESSPVRTFKGAVANWSGSHARFTVTDDRIEGVILTPEERYFIEPAGKYSTSALSSDFVFYKASDVLPSAAAQEPSDMCGVSLAKKIDTTSKQVAPQTSTASSSALIVELATEADYEYVTALGGSVNANNEILSIMNQVEGVYETELGITFQIVYQNTWATQNDPYTTTADSIKVLDEFKNYWNANFTHINRDLAHMWTGKQMGGVIGRAIISSVCNDPQASISYSISRKYDLEPMKYVLTAHEIGHNFGATHDYDVPGCDGTIMFYTTTPSLTFCQFSRDQITQYLNQFSSCISPTPKHRITGRVADANGASVGGVTLTLDGTQSATTQTDASGAYSFADLVPGNYTITPSKTGLSFDPQSRTFNDLSSDHLADFTAVTATLEMPVLLGEENTRRAIALDSVTWMAEPFPLISTHNLSADGRTRVMLFALNVNPLSTVTAQAENLQHQIYSLPIEFIGKVPNFDWLTQINVSLPDELKGAGDVWVSINVQNTVSNKVIVTIK